MKIRFENESLLHYIREARALVNDFLGAAFPGRRGAIYGRRGVPVEPDMRSIVLNREF
jgi:hypothetical protein